MFGYVDLIVYLCFMERLTNFGFACVLALTAGFLMLVASAIGPADKVGVQTQQASLAGAAAPDNKPPLYGAENFRFKIYHNGYGSYITEISVVKIKGCQYIIRNDYRTPPVHFAGCQSPLH